MERGLQKHFILDTKKVQYINKTGLMKCSMGMDVDDFDSAKFNLINDLLGLGMSVEEVKIYLSWENSQDVILRSQAQDALYGCQQKIDQLDYMVYQKKAVLNKI